MEAEIQKKEIKWWRRWEVWGTALQGFSALLMLWPTDKTAYKIGAGIGIALGTATQVKGLLKGYRADNLYPGISKIMDPISNKVTGVRGSGIKFLLFLLMFLATNLQAQKTGFGIGVGASSTIGLNVKTYVFQHIGVSSFISYHTHNGSLQSMIVHFDLHVQPYFEGSHYWGDVRYPIYIGLGVKAKPVYEPNERYLWNLRFITGLSICPFWKDNPGWDLSFECVPTLEISPITSIYLNGMAIFRIWF